VNILEPAHADRIAGGRDSCFAAIEEDRLAAYAWFARGSIEAENNRGGQENSGVAVSFPDHVAFMYKGFTLPDYRGLGLYRRINRLAMLGLGVHGVQYLLSTLDWTNHAAYRSCRQIGFVQLGRLWRWGWNCSMHTTAPRAAKQLGCRFGEAAIVNERRSPPSDQTQGVPPTDHYEAVPTS
jgi:hypothetical protein